MSHEYLGDSSPLQAAFSENTPHSESKKRIFEDWRDVRNAGYDTALNFRYNKLMGLKKGAKATAAYVETEVISEEEMQEHVRDLNHRRLDAGNNERLVRLLDRKFDQLNPIPVAGNRFEVTRKYIPLFHEDDMRKPKFTDRTRAMIEFGNVFWRPMDRSNYIVRNKFYDPISKENSQKWFTSDYEKHAGPLGMFTFFNEKMFREHLGQKEVYGLQAKEDGAVRFGAIDLDLHVATGGNPKIFLKQVEALLSHLQGKGWYICLNADAVDGIHLLNIYEHEKPLAIVRSEIQKTLNEVSDEYPELEAEAIDGGMKPIREAEIYPDSRQGFRLPLGHECTALTDKPLTLVKHRTICGVPYWGADVVSFMSWDKTEMSLEAKMKFISERVPVDCAELQRKEKKAQTKRRKKQDQAEKAITNEKKHLGPMRGRYRNVLVDFFRGNMQVPGSLQTGILLGANALWAQNFPLEERTDYLLELIQKIKISNPHFSSRLLSEDWDAVRFDIQHTIDTVEAVRANPESKKLQKSNEILQGWAEAMNVLGFSFGDPATWDRQWGDLSRPSHWIPYSEESLSEVDLNIIHERIKPVMKCSNELAVATVVKIINIVRIKARSGDGIAQKYRRALLSDMGIKCGNDQKSPDVWKALCDSGFIYESQKPIFHVIHPSQGRARGYGLGSRVSDYFRKHMSRRDCFLPKWLDECIDLDGSVSEDSEVNVVPEVELQFFDWTSSWLQRKESPGIRDDLSISMPF